MHENGVFTNVLWYLEFFAFAFTLIAFFYFFLYLASINYVRYGPKYDFRKKISEITQPAGLVRSRRNVSQDHKPVCCDLGCIWFCSIIFSIVTIGLCYYLAYALLSDTKLRFGIFIP